MKCRLNTVASGFRRVLFFTQPLSFGHVWPWFIQNLALAYQGDGILRKCLQYTLFAGILR